MRRNPMGLPSCTRLILAALLGGALALVISYYWTDDIAWITLYMMGRL